MIPQRVPFPHHFVRFDAAYPTAVKWQFSRSPSAVPTEGSGCRIGVAERWRPKASELEHIVAYSKVRSSGFPDCSWITRGLEV